MPKPLKIMLIAGEASGDAHAAKVIEALRLQNAAVDCFGIGGPKMQVAGCRIVMDSKTIAVMGLFEVLKHFKAIKRAWKLAVQTLEQEQPDCVILIDYPGFNLRFAEKVKALGIKVLYYVSPQIWAWKKKRIHTIKRLVNHMAVILPFEEAIYQQAGVPVTFVGSPVLEQVPLLSKAKARAALQVSPKDVLVGLLPGSRMSEISRLLPVLLQSAVLIKQQHPEVQFFLPMADTLSEAEIAPYLAESGVDVVVLKGQSHFVMAAADVLVGSSGTATLEAAIIGAPMVVIYKMNALTFAIAKRVVKIPFISLPNILAQKRIYPELIQEQADPQAIARETVAILDDANLRAEIKANLRETVKLLGEKGAGERVAELALNVCDHERGAV